MGGGLPYLKKKRFRVDLSAAAKFEARLEWC